VSASKVGSPDAHPNDRSKTSRQTFSRRVHAARHAKRDVPNAAQQRATSPTPGTATFTFAKRKTARATPRPVTRGYVQVANVFVAKVRNARVATGRATPKRDRPVGWLPRTAHRGQNALKGKKPQERRPVKTALACGDSATSSSPGPRKRDTGPPTQVRSRNRSDNRGD